MVQPRRLARDFPTEDANQLAMEAIMTDAEQIDALAFQLMRALDKVEVLEAEREELRVKLALRTRQLKLADDLIETLDLMEGPYGF